jgi:hypothetical protein
VSERANSSINEWNLIEYAIEKGSVRLDVVGVDGSFHSSTPAHWDANRKKLPLTPIQSGFASSRYRETWQVNLMLNHSANSWTSEGIT